MLVCNFHYWLFDAVATVHSRLCPFRPTICWIKRWKTSQESSKSISLGCVAPLAVLNGCCSFCLPFVSLHVEYYFWSIFQFLLEIKNKHNYRIASKQPGWFCCETLLLPDRLTNDAAFWLNILLKKSFFHFDKEQVYFLYSEKDGVIFIHLIYFYPVIAM